MDLLGRAEGWWCRKKRGVGVERGVLRWDGLFFLLGLLLLNGVAFGEAVDVLVYGATPAGIAAAVAAGREGERVLLVEPGTRIGGALSNGRSRGEFRSFESLSGIYREFAGRVERFYRGKYGGGSEQERLSLKGTNGEPRVNLEVLEGMLVELGGVELRRSWVLEELRCSQNGVEESVDASRSAEIGLFCDQEGRRHHVKAAVFIDATYEGDLMAAAGVRYRVGREGRDEYGESAAPAVPDVELQAYGFAMTVTRESGNRVRPKMPRGYDRGEFEDVALLLERGGAKGVFGNQGGELFALAQTGMPNGKFEVCDGAVVRVSLPGENLEWPDGYVGFFARGSAGMDASAGKFHRLGVTLPRERILGLHRGWSLGLLYFLQNDALVPEQYRLEAREWGFPRDEFEDNGHLPEALDVREARRMLGVRVFSQRDILRGEGDARSVWVGDSVAVGDCGASCLGTGREGGRFKGRHTGEFSVWSVPYQVPFGVMVPRNVENLMVVGALSATHVGYGALRMEPVRMALGQAAGVAAHMARVGRKAVQGVDVVALRDRLAGLGAAAVYFSDLEPGTPDFSLGQWWGSRGGFHGLEAACDPMVGGPVGAGYFGPFPGHAADLGRVLDERVERKWRLMAARLGVKGEVLPVADGRLTRREWLMRVRELVSL